MVYIHPRNHHFSSSLAVSVPFIAEDEIHVSAKIYSSPSQPYTQCKNIDSVENKKINFFSERFAYDVNFCRLSCYQAHFMSINNDFCLRDIPCNPKELSNAFGWDIPKFSNSTNSQKINNVYSYKSETTLFINASQKEKARVCDRICPEPCTKTFYTASSIRFNSEGQLRGSAELQYIIIRFKGQMEVFETKPKFDVYYFVSSMGGTLGLFTGFSLLTAVELGELGARLATLLCLRAACLSCVMHVVNGVKALLRLPRKLFGRSRVMHEREKSSIMSVKSI